MTGGTTLTIFMTFSTVSLIHDCRLNYPTAVKKKARTIIVIPFHNLVLALARLCSLNAWLILSRIPG